MTFQKDNTFFTGRLKSVVFAFQGALKLIRTEHSIMVQVSLALLVTFAGLYFQISREEWMFQVLAIGMVLASESLNTAIEKTADYIHPDFDAKIGFIKDIAAGGVFFAAICAIIIGLFIYLPKIGLDFNLFY